MAQQVIAPTDDRPGPGTRGAARHEEQEPDAPRRGPLWLVFFASIVMGVLAVTVWVALRDEPSASRPDVAPDNASTDAILGEEKWTALARRDGTAGAAIDPDALLPLEKQEFLDRGVRASSLASADADVALQSEKDAALDRGGRVAVVTTAREQVDHQREKLQALAPAPGVVAPSSADEAVAMAAEKQQAADARGSAAPLMTLADEKALLVATR